MSLNKVCLIGNLGRDPEQKVTQSGLKVVNMAIATTEKWKDKEGQAQERTEWHRIVIWNDKIADLATKFLRKGSKIYLEGALQTRKYQDANGVEKSVTEVVLQRYSGDIRFLGHANTVNQANNNTTSNATISNATVEEQVPTSSQDLPDEIPF